jgi:predicted dinucleotide-binding enzyme
MSIGIIGAGNLGSNFARALAGKSIPAMISSRRGPTGLKELASQIGPSIRPVSVADAALADTVLIALRWVDLESALRPLPAWNGRIVIDGTNPVAFLEPNSPEARDPENPLGAYGIKAIDLQGQVSSEVFAKLVPGARVVKAFNHLQVELLPLPRTADGQRVLFYSGNDADAKAKVARLIAQLDFLGVDLGPLGVGGRLTQVPGGTLATLNLISVRYSTDVQES